MLGGLGLLLLRSNRNFQKTISVQCCRGISAPCSHLSMEHSHFRVNALNIPQNVVKVLLKVQIKDFTNWGLSQTFPSHPHFWGCQECPVSSSTTCNSKKVGYGSVISHISANKHPATGNQPPHLLGKLLMYRLAEQYLLQR